MGFIIGSEYVCVTACFIRYQNTDLLPHDLMNDLIATRFVSWQDLIPSSCVKDSKTK